MARRTDASDLSVNSKILDTHGVVATITKITRVEPTAQELRRGVTAAMLHFDLVYADRSKGAYSCRETARVDRP